MKKFNIGVVGAGRFSKCFIPLFQSHPFTGEVSVADIISERRQKYQTLFGLKNSYGSFDEMLELADIDAIAIFTQRHLHGEQVVKALRAGKHVYCAVPMAIDETDIFSIIEEVKRTRLIYMTGETSYYYPDTVLCRDRFRSGLFGDFVYGEAQYLHDMSHGFYDSFKHSGGADWKQVAGLPPMFYPTHSVSMILSVTGARATHVSCFGYRDSHADGIFREGGNLWNNPFSNESALMRTSDGGMMRLNEFRRTGGSGVYMGMFGTNASFEENDIAAVWKTIGGQTENLTEDLKFKDEGIHVDMSDPSQTVKRDFNSSLAKAHHAYRLPHSYRKMPNGHNGSHQFLVDDFMKALRTEKLPPNNAWRRPTTCCPASPRTGPR